MNMESSLSRKPFLLRAAILTALVSLGVEAQAHPGHAEGSDFAAGLLHVLSGPDHLVALAFGVVIAAGYNGWLLRPRFVFTSAVVLAGYIGFHSLLLPGGQSMVFSSGLACSSAILMLIGFVLGKVFDANRIVRIREEGNYAGQNAK